MFLKIFFESLCKFLSHQSSGHNYRNFLDCLWRYIIFRCLCEFHRSSLWKYFRMFIKIIYVNFLGHQYLGHNQRNVFECLHKYFRIILCKFHGSPLQKYLRMFMEIFLESLCKFLRSNYLFKIIKEISLKSSQKSLQSLYIHLFKFL